MPWNLQTMEKMHRPGSALLRVSVRRQRLELWLGGRRVKTYRISTAANGVGGRENSFQTPPGLHRVVRWIGAGRPAGAVFKSRRFTGEVVPPTKWRDPAGPERILTRILRLRGCEPGVNAGPGCDSYSRYIYIHGTNREQDLGRPASRGCIRMGNRDVIDLFNRTRGRPTWCVIES
ncbi:MAG: L,D-transpeptidase [Kiritimatiellae bacterium]|nr:L,D-transpeptidase [Kiritimatiellia bacterium]MDW8458439.1 L,D-transpeptidase [Verrucomicrobiota bacterium]